MVTEDRIKTRIDAIWRSGASPLRKARQLLSLSNTAKALSAHLMNLGFRAHSKGENETGRMFWSSSASLIDLSSQARSQAKAALESAAGPPERIVPTQPRHERTPDTAPFCERLER